MTSRSSSTRRLASERLRSSAVAITPMISEGSDVTAGGSARGGALEVADPVPQGLEEPAGKRRLGSEQLPELGARERQHPRGGIGDDVCRPRAAVDQRELPEE